MAENAANELVTYAIDKGIIDPGDARWAYNRILECIGAWDCADLAKADGPLDANGSSGEEAQAAPAFDLDGCLARLSEVGVANGQAEDSATGCDRLCMRIMGALMPRPSEVADTFGRLVDTVGSQEATDWFYRLCCDVNYVRRSAIARNIAWTTDTRWGDLEITINKSKPEKDPRDIAAAGAAKGDAAYPACQLCLENEGYSGRPASVAGGHPARQNLRLVPIELGGETWGLQYSPYAYFEEHCIAISPEHRKMHVDRANIDRLLDFVTMFPHYFVGSNADLPIVGGSILSHDHFQGGRHVFPMMEAEVAETFTVAGAPDVSCGVVRWPLSVLRLVSHDRRQLLDAAVRVLDLWRGWDDPAVGIVSHTGETRHNTVTPICSRTEDGAYGLDLALRCNVTSAEHPLGVFHPHEDKWHVKKENIGLIEVMGLAILPPRLEGEIAAGRLTRDEIGRVFGGVLEDAGVYKWDADGRAAQRRFVEALA
ncbi:MAG: UDP-glucose--hexose-1-phosphate uridylyltransferase [Olegusella sp.]|nr:UDP-glucose--hexose-1-phosphate uridylyltransferase [Olegusella sp.]